MESRMDKKGRIESRMDKEKEEQRVGWIGRRKNGEQDGQGEGRVESRMDREKEEWRV